MAKQIDFNPVKEDKDGVKAKRVIWSTKSLNLALEGLEQGRKLIANPFYENNTKLLKGDLVFQRTDEEIKEWKKCKKNIIHFSERWCQLMTPQGIQNISLRDYQVDYLKHLEKNRLSIMLSARQAGKCVDFTTTVKIKINKYKCPITDCKLNYLNRHYKHNNDIYYDIPMFEIYDIFNDNILWKMKFVLYFILFNIMKFNNFLKKLPGIKNSNPLKFLENCIESVIFLCNNKTSNIDDKFVDSKLVDGIRCWADLGWTPIAYVHNTVPYDIYEIETERGYKLRCADEHIIYISRTDTKYVKDLTVGDTIITNIGPDKIIKITQVKRKVNMCDLTVLNDNESYYTNNILSHNTTTSALFMLHYICFNIDKNALVLGNKRKTAVEILDKAKKIFMELPYFLKPGIYKWNEAEVVLDNGCRLMAEATTINSGISFTFHCVLADEFAHVAPNIIDKFYNNLFPTISAGRARFMITSTQNGYNLFYRLWMGAISGDNEYAPFEVTWDMIPEWNPDKQTWEKRDENWKRLQIANYGSEEAFNSQFGTDFDVSEITLISKKILAKNKSNAIEFKEKDIPGVPYSQYYRWHPDYDPTVDLKKDYIVITGDLAEGTGGDNTVFMIHKMTKDGFECVGFFKSNNLKRELYTLSIQMLICLYTNQEHLLLSHEKNTYGDIFTSEIEKNASTDPVISKHFSQHIMVKYFNESGSKYNIGIKITPGNKTLHCTLYKDAYERDKIINNSTQYMIELTNFTDNGTGHFEAAFGHDDMVMASIQLEFVKETLQYKILYNEFLDTIDVIDQTIQYNPYINDEDSQGYNPYNTIYNYNSYINEQYESHHEDIKNRLISF